MSIKLIIRADDLGYSEGVNYGIEKSVKDGIVNNVGLMVNMPATVHGYQLISDEDIDLSCHVNFSVGKPISNPKVIPSLVDQEGNFIKSSIYRKTNEDLVDYEEARIEVFAQLKKFIEITGHKPDYFEGHAITSQNFVRAIRDIAQENNLIFIGLTDKDNRIGKYELELIMESMETDYNPYSVFERIINNSDDSRVKVFILHPGYLDEDILTSSSLLRPRPLEVDFAISDETKKLIKNKQVDLIKFSDLVRD